MLSYANALELGITWNCNELHVSGKILDNPRFVDDDPETPLQETISHGTIDQEECRLDLEICEQ